MKITNTEKMKAQTKVRTTSVFLRVTPAEKKILEEAAAAERRTLTNFLVTAGLERAKK